MDARLCRVWIYGDCFFFIFRFIVTWHPLGKAGLSSLDSQTMTPKTGWMTQGLGGMTGIPRLETQPIHWATPTWSLWHSGWSAETRSKSRAAMTLNTLLCCTPQVTVWVDKHTDRKSQAMVTSGMAQFGPVTSAWGIARFNMAVNTKQLRDLNRPPVVGKSKAQTRSASGVTGVQAMEL